MLPAMSPEPHLRWRQGTLPVIGPNAPEKVGKYSGLFLTAERYHSYMLSLEVK
jgi:hypothetical protein